MPRDRLVEEVRAREAAGWPLVGTWASEAARVEAWRPRASHEADHRTIPHELDWLRTAVHLTKGCYRGQESVARVHNLGRPPRRLVMLHLDGSGHLLPEPGAAVHDVVRNADSQEPGRVVGQVTTVARHHELGPVALAVVKRSVPADAELVVRVRGRVGRGRSGADRAGRRRVRGPAGRPRTPDPRPGAAPDACEHAP